MPQVPLMPQVQQVVRHDTVLPKNQQRQETRHQLQLVENIRSLRNLKDGRDPRSALALAEAVVVAVAVAVVVCPRSSQALAPVLVLDLARALITQLTRAFPMV
jgi:hypothetical protein